jgi:hypothetical protein
MKFTLQFKLLVIFCVVFLSITALAFNQYLLSKTLEAQARFDTTVMKQNQTIQKRIEATAETIKALSVTPTPIVLPIRRLVK